MGEDQRKYLADKFGDLANLAIAALIFGQLASGKKLDIGLTRISVGIGLMLYFWGFILVKSIKGEK